PPSVSRSIARLDHPQQCSRASRAATRGAVGVCARACPRRACDHSHPKRLELRGAYRGTGTPHFTQTVHHEADSLHGFSRRRGRVSDLLSRQHLRGSRRSRGAGRALERESTISAGAPVILFHRTVVRRRTGRKPAADPPGRGALRRQRYPWRLPQAYCARAVSTSTIFSTLTIRSI